MIHSHSFLHGATVFQHSSVPRLFWVVGNELEKVTFLGVESQSLISEADIKEKMKHNEERTGIGICICSS